MKIRKQDLQFSPLEQVPWLSNARVKINDRTLLSISYNNAPGSWWVGDEDDYEVGIMLHDGAGREGSLVYNGDGNNVVSHCDLKKINDIAEEAASLVYAGHIKVYESQPGSSDKTWFIRHHCAEGEDMRLKLEYTKNEWGQHYLVVPVVHEPVIFES